MSEELSGYRQISVSSYTPPFWTNYYETVVIPLLNEFLPQNNHQERERVYKQRFMVLANYVYAGLGAKETSKKMETAGCPLSATGVRQLAFRLVKRAEESCKQHGIQPPEESGSLPHFDWCQWERRFHPHTKKQPPIHADAPRAHTLTIADMDRGIDGDEELLESINLYGKSSRDLLADLGAVQDERDVALRFAYVHSTGTREVFSCAPQHFGLKPLELPAKP